MAKIPRGRLAGLHGMETKTAEELHAWADQFERQARSHSVADDPDWLLQRAKRLRHLAEQKEKACQHKETVRRRREKSTLFLT